MIELDYVMNLLDWNKTADEQARGRYLAREIHDIRIFMQPCNQLYNKNVWENCAKIISERGDDELAPHLVTLLEWLQDLTWPGAICVKDRLLRYSDISSFEAALDCCLRHAQETEDHIWENNLIKIKQASFNASPLPVSNVSN